MSRVKSPVIRSNSTTNVRPSPVTISKPQKPNLFTSKPVVSIVERTVIIIVTTDKVATIVSYVPITSQKALESTTTTTTIETTSLPAAESAPSMNQSALIISLVSIALVFIFGLLSFFLYRKWSRKKRPASEPPMARYIFNSPPQTPPPSNFSRNSLIYLTETMSEGRNSIIENALQRNPSLRMSGYENYNDYYYYN
jgi:hypothetical protein